MEGLALWERGVVGVCWCGGARGACGDARLWRGGELAVAARLNAAPSTSGRIGCLQQGHALGVVTFPRKCEGRIAYCLEVQPGPGLDEEVQALVVAFKCGRNKGRVSVLLGRQEGRV